MVTMSDRAPWPLLPPPLLLLRRLLFVGAAVVVAAAAAAGPGCLSLGDVPERAREDYGPFADELFEVWRQELRRSEPAALAPARQARLQQMAPEVKLALAALVQGRVGDAQDGLLAVMSSPQVLARWDDGTMDGVLRDLGLLLRALERDEGPALAAAARMLEARGATNPEGPWRLLHRLVRQDDLLLLSELHRLLQEHRDSLTALHDRAGQWLRGQGVGVPVEGGRHGMGEGGGEGSAAAVAGLWSRAVDDALLTPGCASLGQQGLALAGCSRPDGLAPGSLESCLCDLAALRGSGPVLTVRLDRLGNPLVLRPEGGVLPPPFVDRDGDGEPDVDQAGRPVAADGSPIHLPPLANPVAEAETAEVSRNSLGQAVVPRSTQPFFDYVELKGSLLGLAVHAASSLLEPGKAGTAPLEDLLTVLPVLLGPEIPAGDGHGGQVFDAEQSPLLDLAHGLVELLRYPRLQALCDAAARLARSRPELPGRLLAELGDALAILTEGPAVLAADSTLLDDLLGDNPFLALGPGSDCPVELDPGEACSSPSWLTCAAATGRCIVRPGRSGPPGILEALALEQGLLRELLRVAADEPALRTLPVSLAHMVSHTGTDFSALQLDAASCSSYVGAGGVMPSELPHRCWIEVDRSEPDDPRLGGGGGGGRSAFQNLLALIYDTSRLAYDPRLVSIGGREVLPGELIIPNVAAFYLDSTVDNARVESASFSDTVLRPAIRELLCELALEDTDGEPLTPTSAQLNLWILRDHVHPGNVVQDIGNVVDHQGLESRKHNADMLVALASRIPPEPPPPCWQLVDARGQIPAELGQPSLLQGLRPIVRVFSRHGMPAALAQRGMQQPSGRTQLLLDLLGTLHIHWGTYRRAAGCPLRWDLPGAQGAECDYAADGLYRFDRQQGGGLRNLEPKLVRLVHETELFPVLFELLAAAEETGLADELPPFLQWLLDREALPRGEWRLRRSDARGVRRGDGMGWEPRPARLHALLAAVRELRQRLDEPEQGEARVAWERLDLGLLLRGRASDGGLHRRVLGHLAREGLVAAAELLRPRLADEAARAGWLADLDRLELDLSAAVGEPALHALVRLGQELQDDARARQWLLELVRSLCADPGGPDADRRGAWLETVLELGRMQLPPGTWGQAARGLGALLDDQQRPLLDLLERLGLLDQAVPDEVLAALLANGLGEERSRAESVVPLRTLLKALAQTLRLEPLSAKPLAREDLDWLVRAARRFVEDRDHGLSRLGTLVRQRMGTR